MNEFEMIIFFIFAILWYGAGIYGLIVMYNKGYFSALTEWGCLIWIVAGWNAILIAFLLAIGLGPITYLFANSLKPKQRCPGCQTWLGGDVSRCPHCTSNVVPLR